MNGYNRLCVRQMLHTLTSVLLFHTIIKELSINRQRLKKNKNTYLSSRMPDMLEK